MTTQPLSNFGAGWSEQKLLCYWANCHAINTLGCIELLQEPKQNESDSEKRLQIALQQAKAAVDALDELYKMICKRKGKELSEEAQESLRRVRRVDRRGSLVGTH